MGLNLTVLHLITTEVRRPLIMYKPASRAPDITETGTSIYWRTRTFLYVRFLDAFKVPYF